MVLQADPKESRQQAGPLHCRGAFVPRPPTSSSNGRGVDRLGSLPIPPTSYAPSLPRLQIPPTPVPSALPLPADPQTPPHITYFNAPEHPPRRSDLAVQIAWTEAVNRLMSPEGPEVRPLAHGWLALKPPAVFEYTSESGLGLVWPPQES